jgi:hypothetical protein
MASQRCAGNTEASTAAAPACTTDLAAHIPCIDGTPTDAVALSQAAAASYVIEGGGSDGASELDAAVDEGRESTGSRTGAFSPAVAHTPEPDPTLTRETRSNSLIERDLLRVNRTVVLYAASALASDADAAASNATVGGHGMNLFKDAVDRTVLTRSAL